MRGVVVVLLGLSIVMVVGGQNPGRNRGESKKAGARSASLPVSKPLPPPIITIDLLPSTDLPFELPNLSEIPLIKTGFSDYGPAADSAIPFANLIQTGDGNAKANVVEEVSKAQETSLWLNDDETPLAIIDARIKAVSPYNPETENSSTRRPYVFQIQAALSNKTERRIVGFVLELSDRAGWAECIFDTMKISIEPHSTQIFGEGKLYEANFSMPPSGLMLNIRYVVFEDGSWWRAEAGHFDKSARLSSLPRLLNVPRPDYTVEAKKNNVSGIVALRVLVGVDGLVKSVKLIRGLPDGLSEKAIEAAYKLKFEPATVGDQPVKWWHDVLIEFRR